MKIIFFLSVLTLLFSSDSFAQEEFSFELYFEDAAGNRDTITIGYDEDATNGIDTAFGEENMITQPWDTIFDIRVTDEYWNRVFFQSGIGTYHTKKQITKLDNGSSNSQIIVIDMNIIHWPITISWNSTLFNETNFTEGSFITPAEYGVWGDWGVPIHYVSEENTYQVYPDTFDGAFSYYTSDDNDDIYTLWFVFAEDFLSTTSFVSVSDVDISPNPFTDYFTVQGEVTGNFYLIDNIGRSVSFEQNGNDIRPLNCELGIYFLTLTTEKGNVYTSKIIKN